MTNPEPTTIEPAALEADEAPDVTLPEQEQVYRAPARFGHVPVAREPLGWDPRNPGFRNHYPNVRLPTQVVERVSLGEPELEPNRLIWGDNLHIMRTFPSESIDLIYIDPPFFSNRVYNVIWGDEHEERSFSDIWEGGLDGYLIWLNARLYEMKRLLKPSGSIYVHCDWHASHYIKVEMDKIFGYDGFQNEIVWRYRRWPSKQERFQKMHDVILLYRKSPAARPVFNQLYEELAASTRETWGTKQQVADFSSGRRKPSQTERESPGAPMSDVWEIGIIAPIAKERIGYPTQKPEALLERVITASSNQGDVVLDAFAGGGTTAAVAQRLGRRWIAVDQSRLAVAVSAERLKNAAADRELGAAPIPDFNLEHWGVYEAERLSSLPEEQFREFILDCYEARISSDGDGIHGYKGMQARVPVWVGGSSLTSVVGAPEVNDFAQAIAQLDRYQGDDGLRDGVMLAWGFRPDARRAADELREREGISLAFVRLEQVAIDSPAFRQHITSQSTDRGDYTGFLTFVQPPLVRVASRRVRPLQYEFDASDTQVQNADASILNVQWDFDYDGVTFRAARGEWFHRKGRGGAPVLDAQQTFLHSGIFRVACRVQDDRGGEGEWSGELEVE